MAFPKGFLWGGSISAEQVEGGWDEGGKAPVQLDYAGPAVGTGWRPVYYRNADGSRGVMRAFDHLPDGAHYELFDDVHYTNHVAADFYHRWREDLELFAEMGWTTFNTSVSWARVMPGGIEGGVNEEGVRFYRDLFAYARELGMDPVVTLYKYDEPICLEARHGGWESRAMIDEFEAFSRVCFERLGAYVDKWLTFNEVNIFFMMDKEGRPETITKLHNQMVAAARVTKAAHEIVPGSKVGCMVAGMCAYPYTCDPADVLATYQEFQHGFGYCADTMVFGAYPRYARRVQRAHGCELDVSARDAKDLLEGKADFLAFSYYASMAMTTLIGRGYSRTNIILAKFIDVVLLVIAVNIFYAVIALILMLVFRVPLTGFETKILAFRYLMNIYDMIGNITFAAFFIFLMENSAVGVFIFLATSVLIPALIQFASNTMEFVQKFHLNRLDYNAIGNMAFSDFMLGMPGYAVLKVLIGVVVYVVTFLVLTAVFFNKKELSF